MRAQRINAGLRRILALKTASRLAAWACILAIAVLSLTPAEQMTRTGLSGHIEHVLAYTGAAFIAAMAYGERGIVRVSLALLAYAGGLEVLQRFSPGRTASFEDYIFSVVGVLMGIGAFALLARLLPVSNAPN